MNDGPMCHVMRYSQKLSVRAGPVGKLTKNNRSKRQGIYRRAGGDLRERYIWYN